MDGCIRSIHMFIPINDCQVTSPFTHQLLAMNFLVKVNQFCVIVTLQMICAVVEYIVIGLFVDRH